MQDFLNLKAWFSTSVSDQVKNLWESAGGIVCDDADSASYYFSDDALSADTLNLFEKFKGKNVIFFNSSWINHSQQECSSIPIENYILYPKHVSEEVKLWKDEIEYQKKWKEAEEQRKREFDRFTEEMKENEEEQNTDSDTIQDDQAPTTSKTRSSKKKEETKYILKSANSLVKTRRAEPNEEEVGNEDSDNASITSSSKRATIAKLRQAKEGKKTCQKISEDSTNRYSLRNSKPRKVSMRNKSTENLKGVEKDIDFQTVKDSSCNEVRQENEKGKSGVKPNGNTTNQDARNGDEEEIVRKRSKRSSAIKAIQKMSGKSDTTSNVDTIVSNETNVERINQPKPIQVDKDSSKKKWRTLLPTSPEVYVTNENEEKKKIKKDTKKQLSPSEIQDALGNEKKRIIVNAESASPQLPPGPNRARKALSSTVIDVSSLVENSNVISSPQQTMEKHKEMLIHKKVGATSAHFLYGSLAGFPHIDDLQREEIDLQDFIVNKNGCQVKLKSVC